MDNIISSVESTASATSLTAIPGEDPVAIQKALDDLREQYGFDLVIYGSQDPHDKALKWRIASGAETVRWQRISLSPGRGIGGIVLVAGNPMLLTDIDTQMDPREYSSFPLIFAEGLKSFCALPLRKGVRARAVLLCGFRELSPEDIGNYRNLIISLADGFLDFSVNTDDLEEALDADEGDRFKLPDIEDRFEVWGEDDGISQADPYKELSPAELEIFVLLARGLSNKEAATVSNLSVKTIETHRSRIYRKLRIRSRAQLVHLAIRHQIFGF